MSKRQWAIFNIVLTVILVSALWLTWFTAQHDLTAYVAVGLVAHAILQLLPARRQSP